MSGGETSGGGSGREQRLYERHPVFLDAAIELPDAAPVPGKIRDYCRAGLFVAWEWAPPASMPDRGAPIVVRFRTPGVGAPGIEHVLHATVARAGDSGIGIALSEAEPKALDALAEYARIGERGDAGAASAAGVDRNAILARCRELVHNHVRPAVDEFLRRIDERMFSTAREAFNDADQRKLFDTMAAIQTRKEPIARGVVDAMVDGLDHLGEVGHVTVDNAPKPSGLSLVGKEEFEELLIIGDIVARVERDQKDVLWRIERRFTQIARGVVNRGNNPVGPSVACRSISKSFASLLLPPEHMRTIYEIAEQVVMPRLVPLYREVDELLARSGLMPGLEHAPDGSDVPRPKPRTARQDGGGDGDGGGGSGGGVSAGPAAPATVAGFAPGQPAVGAPAGMAAAAAASVPGAVPGTAPGMVAAPAAGAGVAAGAVPASVGPVGTGPVIGGAPGVAGMQAAAQGVQAGGAGAVSAAGVEAAPAQVPAYVPSGPAVPVPAAPQAFQAMRTLLGLQRGLGAGGRGAPAPAAAEAGSAAVAQPGGVAIAGAAGGAAPAYSKDELLRAIQALEGEEHARWAEETAGADFGERLKAALASQGGAARQIGDRESDAMAMVSGIVESLQQDHLLSAPLRPRLGRLGTALTKLAVSDENFLSDAAHPARQLINRIAQLDLEATLGGESTIGPRVGQIVERLARDAGRDSGVYRDLLDEVDSIQSERGGEYRRNLRALVQECEQHQVAQRAKRRPGQERAQQKEVSKEWAVWLNRAKALRVGDVVSLKRGGQAPQRVSLAWVGEEHNPFVFANSKGSRVASMTLQELAMQLRRGLVRVMDRADLPALDRALYQTLYRMHDRIGQQALQDEQTGLVNRRRFEALLEQRRVECVERDARYALARLRLTGVDALLDRGGPGAAASLIRKIAALVAERVGAGATLARIDEREFGLLLASGDIDVASRTMEDVLAVIEKVRVRYREEKFGIGGNAGLVAMTAASPSVAALMQDAATACDDAIALGANRVAVHVPVAPTVVRPEDRIDWRAWLDSTLAADRLALRAQCVRLAADPAAAGAYCAVHVGAEDGQEFVPLPEVLPDAAELVDKIRALDRLAIRETFRWMALNRDLLDKLGGCAVRLSPQSLADPSLMDYVLGQLTESMVPPGKLVFEIADAAARVHLEEAERLIRTLREFGCRFALEGFGAGETAQGYLNNLPVDFLKIAPLFVAELDRNASDAAVVRSITEIARLMGKRTIAAGVASAEVLARLREIGVEFAQGGAVSPMCAIDEIV
ncbi:MAG: DUF1631 family protein [Gammaproteobacteria bacterium]